MFLLRPVFGDAFGLAVLRHEIGWLHVLGLPIKIRNLVFRPQEIFRVAMAFQAPSHAHRLSIVNLGHVIDLAVTTGATNSAIYVGGVIVENVVRQAMDPDPIDRTAILPALAHRLELRIVLLHLSMAVHANLGIWNV